MSLFSLTALVPFLPLVAFLVLVLGGGRMGERTLRWWGTVPAGLGAVVALVVTARFLAAPPAGNAYTQVLWTWFTVDGFAPQVAFRLDPLSLVMVAVVACVGLLILVFSTDFMRGDEGYRRFFAYMNLFIFAMLVLVLADDLLFLMVGWEGVGLSSYLLIGFWYQDPANGAAARKAFIVTRVGDTALLVGLFLLFSRLGTLNIQEAMGLAQQDWAAGSAVATAAALLVLGGAVGKSAQLPLQTWLPDAMAGPTPVSALIHAATMVTAGVYLVARTHVLFELSPAARTVVAVIGAVTLLYAGLSALAQSDIKRVLAYSTISQIGYMFLALGVGAWAAAVFHFMTHAFFKALLFLAAGLVIKALAEEHDIHKMGGLRRTLPVVFWTFLAGAASLSAVPGITAGFFSKDLIIGLTLTSAWGGVGLWLVGVLGAFLTSLYAFRLVFVVFFGDRAQPSAGPETGEAGTTVRRPASTSEGPVDSAPLSAAESDGVGDLAPPRRRFAAAAVAPIVLLAVAAVGSGWIQLPADWVRLSLVTDFLAPVLPAPPGADAAGTGFAGGAAPQMIVVLLSLAGILAAYLLFGRQRPLPRSTSAPAAPSESPAAPSSTPSTVTVVAAFLRRAAREGFGFDRLYNAALVRSFVWLARTGKDDVIDQVFTAGTRPIIRLHGLLSRTQSGRLRYYLAVVSLGVAVFIAVGIWR